MIDSHIHILPGIDDGAKNIQISFDMIQSAKKCGFEKIIATPHYIENSLDIDYNIINRKVEELNKVIRQDGTDIEVLCGNEIYYTSNILKILEEKKVHTLNNTRYFLVELPIVGMPFDYVEVLKQCIDKGYIPIIAHPERYEWFDRGYQNFVQLKKLGAKFQVNFGSFIKEYGVCPKRNVIKLLKNDMVDLIATDAHKVGNVYNKFEKIIKKIIFKCGREKFIMFTNTNPNKILNDELI